MILQHASQEFVFPLCFQAWPSRLLCAYPAVRWEEPSPYLQCNMGTLTVPILIFTINLLSLKAQTWLIHLSILLTVATCRLFWSFLQLFVLEYLYTHLLPDQEPGGGGHLAVFSQSSTEPLPPMRRQSRPIYYTEHFPRVYTVGDY